MCVTTWNLFETLLTKPHEHVVKNLVLRNLVDRGYTTSVSLPGSIISSPIHELRGSSHLSLPSSPLLPSEILPDLKPSPLLFKNAGGIDISENSLSPITPPNTVSSAAANVDLMNCERQLSTETERKSDISSSSNQVAGVISSSSDQVAAVISSSSDQITGAISSSSDQVAGIISSAFELKENGSPGFEMLEADFVDEEKKPGVEEQGKRSSVAVMGEGDGPLPLATVAMETCETNCDFPDTSRIAAKQEQSEISDSMSFNSGYELTDIRHIVNTYV